MKKIDNTNITTSIYLDTRKKKKNGTYPVKLRVTYKRLSRLYKTKYSLSESEFDKVTGGKPRGDFKQIALDVAEIESTARDVINDLDVFSFDKLKKGLFNTTVQSNDVFAALKEYIIELKEESRLGSAVTYESTLQSFKQFYNKPVLKYEDVTPRFLFRYERWMSDKNKSVTTIGFYLRSLRRIINIAIRNGYLKPEEYPFGKDPDKYRIPEPKNVKKGLSLGEIRKIFQYQPDQGSPEHFFRDIWLFSYLCNGMNMKDICLLRYHDLEKDSIQFRRSKTAYSNRKSKPIVAIRTSEVNAIIDRWGTRPIDSDSYVFPFLQSTSSPEKVKAKISQVVKQTNKYINRIALKVGISARITTYTCRHSYATILKQSGVNIAFISEGLGHANIKTTELYLGSFETEERKHIAAKLTDW